MFVVDEVQAEIGFEVAAGRLMHLINQGALDAASEAAYEGGLTAVLRVGPAGAVRGLSKLVRVRFADPVRRAGKITVPVRWEATGAAGDLFPVLDADLILARHGDDGVTVTLAGCYRPPFGPAGAAIDKAVMHRVAAATIRSLLERIAAAVGDPTPRQQPGTGHAPRRHPVTPVTEPDQP